MKRSTPLKRTPFKSTAGSAWPFPAVKDPDRVRSTPTARPAQFRAAEHVDGIVRRATPKVEPIQHKAYMDIVRTFSCCHCGRAGPSQFCHSDALGQGKGMGLKTDCRLGFPGCADCHELLGMSGKLGKDMKHELELRYGAATRTLVRHIGCWPATLPAWPGDAE